ncbi:MAG: LD-carboxypeptidase [Acidimicrobiia bacterium]|nr:LD-carboxypeptidase [Acidimicrobiia bacterium]
MQIQALKPGDTIGLVSLSDATDTPELLERIRRGSQYYNILGFEVKSNQDFLINYKGAAENIQNRAIALHEAILDENVKLVLPLRGGTYFNQLLYDIDYDLICENPKWYGGFSDTSALINLVSSKAKLPTMHGLDVVWHISEYKSFPNWLIDQHKKVLFDPYNFSFKLDSGHKLKDLRNKTLMNNFRSNNVTFRGKLMGGHLGSTPALMGHKCFVDKDLILLLETTLSNEHTLKLLYGLLELDLFKNVNGVILGFSEFDEENYECKTHVDHISLYEALEEILNIANKKYDKNIGLVKTNLFGHETNNILFPLGIDMEFDSNLTVLRAV